MALGSSVLRLCRLQEASSSVGRPSISVDMYEVEFLRSLGFTWTSIAELLGVSRATLYQRLEASGLALQGYSTICDFQLDSLIREIKRNHPNDGEVISAAHLRSREIRVLRARLRASIHRTDPTIASRRHPVVRRRVYHVEAPNCVWHIDGNYKLIHWRIVVHAACFLVSLRPQESLGFRIVFDLIVVEKMYPAILLFTIFCLRNLMLPHISSTSLDLLPFALSLKTVQCKTLTDMGGT